MASSSREEYIVVTRVRDLQPEARAQLEDWRTSGTPTVQHLNEIVRGWYAGFGPNVTATIEKAGKWQEAVLTVTLTIPEGADQDRAAQVFEDGMAHAQAGRLDSALPLFRRAVELWPFDADYHRAHAQAELELGNLSEAEDAFLEGLRLCASDWGALTMLGNVYYKKGELELARSLHEQSLALHQSQYALANLGGVFLKQGQVTAARGLFERALRIDPSYAQARNGLALCEAYEGRGY